MNLKTTQTDKFYCDKFYVFIHFQAILNILNSTEEIWKHSESHEAGSELQKLAAQMKVLRKIWLSCYAKECSQSISLSYVVIEKA